MRAENVLEQSVSGHEKLIIRTSADGVRGESSARKLQWKLLIN
jgi:hypothetical protein